MHRCRAGLLAAMLLLPGAPAGAAAAPAAARATDGGVGFYLGTPGARRRTPLAALTFRQGRPPGRWYAIGRPRATANEIYDDTSNSIMSMFLTGDVAATPLRAGKPLAPLALGGVRTAVDGAKSPPAVVDGRAKDVQAALRRLAPGAYRLAVSFTYSWDEHTDGPTWGSSSRDVARGEIPLQVLPPGP